jgi:pimeloyl-ACP methyl ester carboxylesterase
MSREMGMAREIPFVEGVEHRQVVANGVRVHLAEAGDPAAPPVICLHGWPQHWYLWRDVIGPLAESMRVICPDLRGLGWSEAPPRGYEKETLADDLFGIMDELGVERTSLIGHDWGGFAGFLACIHRPERFDRYLALNIAPPLARANPRTIADSWRLWYQVVLASPLGPRAAAELATDRGRRRFVSRGGDAFTEEELEIFLGQFREPDRARATQQIYRSFLLHDLPAMVQGKYRAARLEVPTRVLFGTDDPVVTDAMLELPGGAADEYEVERFPGVGHFIVDERPDLVVDRALSFLAPVPA